MFVVVVFVFLFLFVLGFLGGVVVAFVVWSWFIDVLVPKIYRNDLNADIKSRVYPARKQSNEIDHNGTCANGSFMPVFRDLGHFNVARTL